MSAEPAVAKLGAVGIAAFTDPAARLRTPLGTLWRGDCVMNAPTEGHVLPAPASPTAARDPEPRSREFLAVASRDARPRFRR